MDGHTIGQFSHPSHGIVLNEFSYQPTVATKGIRQTSIKVTKSHLDELSKAISKYAPPTNTSPQKTTLQNKPPVTQAIAATKMPQSSSSEKKGYGSIFINFFNTISNSIYDAAQTLSLRGEVPFERWYYHYQSPSAIKGLGQISSRAWACAHAIESTIKIIFISLSLSFYVIKSRSAREKRYEALASQICSFLFSSFAIIAPTVTRDDFKKKFNTLKYIAARELHILPSNYTRYTGNTTLKMLTTAH